MTDHPIVHIELSTLDSKASAKFYGDTFSWKITNMEEMDYFTWAPETGPGGGFNPVTEDNPAGSVLLYIQVEDIESKLEQIEKNGGKTLNPKSEIPGIGHFGIFADPTGNKVGLFTPLKAGE